MSRVYRAWRLWRRGYGIPRALRELTLDPRYVVQVGDGTLVAHDHGAMLDHLVDEWGALGVVLQVLRPLNDDQARNLLFVAQREVDGTRGVAIDQSPTCGTCDGDGMVACRTHLETGHNDACFACWNGEPCPECQPDLAL